jgi:hypothetical protein
VDAKTGGLGPAGKTAGTMADHFFSQVDHFDLRAGFTHTLNQVVQQ